MMQQPLEKEAREPSLLILPYFPLISRTPFQMCLSEKILAHVCVHLSHHCILYLSYSWTTSNFVPAVRTGIQV